ncbi:hypothetical protein C8Q78DRAFT_170665 [Trametes maxima]|nr:hypothetical protein C8Q78DRAFT_170665 [Trametes maxima]
MKVRRRSRDSERLRLTSLLPRVTGDDIWQARPTRSRYSSATLPAVVITTAPSPARLQTGLPSHPSRAPITSACTPMIGAGLHRQPSPSTKRDGGQISFLRAPDRLRLTAPCPVPQPRHRGAVEPPRPISETTTPSRKRTSHRDCRTFRPRVPRLSLPAFLSVARCDARARVAAGDRHQTSHARAERGAFPGPHISPRARPGPGRTLGLRWTLVYLFGCSERH